MRIHAHGSFCAYQSSQVMLTALLKIFPANVWNRGKAANKRCQRVMKLNPRKRLKTWKQWKTQLPKDKKWGEWYETRTIKKQKPPEGSPKIKKNKNTWGFPQNRPPVRPDCTRGPLGRPAQILYLSTSGKTTSATTTGKYFIFYTFTQMRWPLLSNTIVTNNLSVSSRSKKSCW